eukprot:CAMPEP_0171226076 /NCGR_PEP_ID=MMETSP0790-20130122/37138_1 /TAXON_ID=2925 /ORGANISM="Alexandrium catenella, Strain OF101" /LENGTH=92 /DNA_ID=CAMNT_0011692133 /DNA_START=128 /DNA_END=402 /DNA_ORIENTATION=+
MTTTVAVPQDVVVTRIERVRLLFGIDNHGICVTPPSHCDLSKVPPLRCGADRLEGHVLASHLAERLGREQVPPEVRRVAAPEHKPREGPHGL